MVENVEFIEDPHTGNITINPNLNVRFVSWGIAEQFKTDIFECNKCCYGHLTQYCAPKVFNEDEKYNASKSDMWQLGIVAFQLFFNKYPYLTQNEITDSFFAALKYHGLSAVLKMHNLRHKGNNKLIAVLNGLLCYNEEDRINSDDVIQSEWFHSYYTRYQQRINKKSKKQILRLANHPPMVPYYEM